MNKKKISVIIPCYFSEKSIARVVEETIGQLEKANVLYEFVLVNDGSTDGTFGVISELAQEYPFVTGVDLAKNCGQHNAILAGMKYADGDYILGMDDDFQTHPTQIHKLIAKLEEGYDIVYGRFPKRHHGFLRNMESKLSHLSVCYLLDKPKDLKACPMYLIRCFVRDEIVRSGSSFSNLQGLFLRTSSRITNADIEHFDRKYGKSGYTLKKLIRLWASLLNYTLKPIRLILYFGVVCSLLGLLYLLASVFADFGFEHNVYAMLILFLGLVLLSVGAVGEYVARMFMAVTKEPQYIIRQDTKNRNDFVFDIPGSLKENYAGSESGEKSNEKEIAYTGRR